MTLKREKQANCTKQVDKGGVKMCPKKDDVICERSLTTSCGVARGKILLKPYSCCADQMCKAVTYTTLVVWQFLLDLEMCIQLDKHTLIHGL